MNIILIINDREAISVRSIPYVTGWLMSPDVVAKKFAHDEPFSARPFEIAAYYKVYENCRPMKPKEWDGILAEIKELECSCNANESGDAVWRRESIPLLPAACFVWKDEFEDEFDLHYSRKSRPRDDDREGERDLVFDPAITKDQHELIMNGFDEKTNKFVMGANQPLWKIQNPKDPEPPYSWYISARYFARSLIVDDPSLLTKRGLLALKVAGMMKDVGISKRGGVKQFEPNTIIKAFVNIDFS
jgi:hypothetical protein